MAEEEITKYENECNKICIEAELAKLNGLDILQYIGVLKDYYSSFGKYFLVKYTIDITYIKQIDSIFIKYIKKLFNIINN